MKKITWIIAILSLIITPFVLQFVPDNVPLHYDIAGNADRYGSRYALMAIPAVIIAVTAVMNILEHRLIKRSEGGSDEEKTKAASNAWVIRLVTLCLAVLLVCTLITALCKCCTASGSGLINFELDSLNITAALCGIMFIICGNFMPKTRLNGAVGVRMSWTMYNDNTWNKSNRFGGFVLLAAGVLTVVTSAFVPGIVAVLMMLLYLTAAVVITLIYAHKVYKEEIGK